MLTFTFPTAFSLDRVTQEYWVNVKNFIGIGKYAPVYKFLTQRVQWEELDAIRGMTVPHVMGTDPKIDKREGSKLREYEPIPFKESDVIDERELLRAREIGTIGNVVNLDRLVARTMKRRSDKTFIRMEWAVWQMFAGQLEVNENGVYVKETFPVQHFATVVPWSDHANATIVKDLEDLSLLYRGTGATAAGATIPINRKDLNHVLNNKNPDDLWGFRGTNFVSTTYSLKQVNDILEGRGVPTFELNDTGFIDKNKNFQSFIADGHPSVIGKRPEGDVIANFGSTPSMHRQENGVDAAGPFSILEVNDGPNNGVAVTGSALGQDSNPNLKVTGGIYGGPVLWYPRSVIALDTTHTGA